MSKDLAGQAELPRTLNLDSTLRRAHRIAEDRSHRYVTFEHLLLALLDDPEAFNLLSASGADVQSIRSAIADAVNSRMGFLITPGAQPPSFSYKFDTLFAAASAEAAALKASAIDGAAVLIALAKDKGSNASSILAANGFNAAAALQRLNSRNQRPAPAPHAVPPPQAVPPPKIEQGPPPAEAHIPPVHHPTPRHQTSSQPGKAEESRPTMASHAARMTSGEFSMEDMLASVRSILEAAERKEQGLPDPQQKEDRGRYRRQEPQVGARLPQNKASGRQAARAFGQEMPYRQARPNPRGAPGAPQEAFHPQPAFELRPDPAILPHPKARAGRDAGPALSRDATNVLAGAFQHIPRKTRVAVPERVEVRLAKEEVALLCSGAAYGRADHAVCRAVTIRLAAPEGGFFIEAAGAETQWIFDRPSFLGQEAFGIWAWTLIPSDSGTFPLNILISVRGLDHNGMASDVHLPEQTLAIRVRGNFWRSFGRLLRTLMLLLAGSGLTVGAYYALKLMGKLPH